MCQPVTTKASLCFVAKRQSTVPTAMAAAAPSIQSSPWLQAWRSLTRGPSSHQWRNRSAGNPRQRMPSTPSNRPTQPTGLMASPKRARASRATNKGWESIRTDPRPAPLRPRPMASSPWKRAPSTAANNNSQGQSWASTARGRPRATATASNTTPAGNRRRAATIRGWAPANKGVIAAIAVPQRAKGSNIRSQRMAGVIGTWRGW